MLCMAVSLVPITVSAESIEYVVAGTDSLFGSEWEFTRESGNLMTEKDGKYELLLSPTEACGTVYFLVAKLTDGVVMSDDDRYGDALGYNIEINVTGGGDILIVFDPNTHEITVSGDNVTVINGLQIDSLRTVGGGDGNWLNGINWDPADDANLMTETSTGVYEITYTGIDAGTGYEFKFSANGEWTDNWGGSIDSENAVYNGKTIIFDTEENNSTVRIVLDLTNFDYTTKSGAIYKLYVNGVQINTSATPSETEKDITLGISGLSGYDSENGYDYTYYGTYNGNSVKWRVLDAAYKYDKNDTSKTSMLLLSENALETTKFGSNTSWNGSTAQTWCSNMYSSSFSAKEQQAVLQTNSDDILNNDRLFFLSYEEASNSAYFKDNAARQATSLDGNAAMWWFRTPFYETSPIIYVAIGTGFFNGNLIYNENNCFARPAFNLNTDSVLFTSAAVDGKSSDVGELTGNTANKGNGYKLTLKDSARSEFTAKPSKILKNAVWISYENATVGENEYISAIIVNNDGDVTHYGKLAKVEEENGTAALYLTDDALASTDTIYVFNEQINGDYKTDFSSELKEIATETKITLTKNKVFAYIDGDEGATLIVASYKDGALKDVKTIAFTSDIYENTLAEIGLDTTDADCIKAFLWDDTNVLTPLCRKKAV